MLHITEICDGDDIFDEHEERFAGSLTLRNGIIVAELEHETGVRKTFNEVELERRLIERALDGKHCKSTRAALDYLRMARSNANV